MNDVVTNYLNTWNETDATARRALLDEHWADAASYSDPMAQVAGREQLDALIAGAQQQFPGFVFSLHGEPDAHHNQIRFGWALGPTGVEPPILGFDVLVVDEDDRITSVLGFLDKVPA